jgi:hypothetical protein
MRLGDIKGDAHAGSFRDVTGKEPGNPFEVEDHYLAHIILRCRPAMATIRAKNPEHGRRQAGERSSMKCRVAPSAQNQLILPLAAPILQHGAVAIAPYPSTEVAQRAEFILHLVFV